MRASVAAMRASVTAKTQSCTAKPAVVTATLSPLLQKVMNSANGIGAVPAPMGVEIPFEIPHRILFGI
jgi:hypothetical protein